MNTPLTETAPYQVGRIGEEIVAKYFKKSNYKFEMTDPSDREMRKVDFIVTIRGSHQFWAEIITRRESRLKGIPTYFITVRKWEYLQQFEKEHNFPVRLYVVDFADQGTSLNGNAIFFKNLTTLKKSIVGEEERQTAEGKMNFVHFDKSEFAHIADIGAEDVRRLKMAFEKLDSENAQKMDGTQQQTTSNTPVQNEELIRARLESECIASLFGREDNSENQDSKLEIIPIRHFKSRYKLPTGIRDNAPLDFIQLENGDWVIKMFTVSKVISGSSANFSLYRLEKIGTLEKACLQLTKRFYDIASEESTQKVLYMGCSYLEDVLQFAVAYLKKAKQQSMARKLLDFWRETVLPRLQNGTMTELFLQSNTKPVRSQPSPISVAPPSVEKSQLTFLDLLEGILNQVELLRHAGFTGALLIPAIKMYTKVRGISPEPLIDFVTLAQAEIQPITFDD